MAPPGPRRHDRRITISTPPPAVYLLIVFPGAGKYTVACELARRLEALGRPTKVIDNHYVNNPIFHLMNVDGRSKLPAEVWELAHRLRDIILETVERLAPQELSFVFTNFIGAHEAEIADPYVARLRRIADARGRSSARLCCDAPPTSWSGASPAPIGRPASSGSTAPRSGT